MKKDKTLTFEEQNRNPLNIKLPSNLGKPGGVRFLDVLNYALNIKLQKCKSMFLTQKNMEFMYELVSETVIPTLKKASVGLHDDTCCWVAQRMYETIKVGSSPIITRDESSWSHDVAPVYAKCTLERVPDSDVRLIAGLFDQASFADEIKQELKRRNLR